MPELDMLPDDDTPEIEARDDEVPEPPILDAPRVIEAPDEDDE